MFIHIVAMSLSIAILWATSTDSPLLVLQNWEVSELLRLLGIMFKTVIKNAA